MTIICRVIAGISETLVFNTIYAMISQIFPQEKLEIIGTNESFLGLGMAIGPAVASFLYGHFGFQTTFFILGQIQICTMVAALVLISSDTNKIG